MVAPNGARLQKADHPALPITLDEMAASLKDCEAAGADGAHIHLRDAQGGHLLDAAGYRAALAILKETAPGLRVQITTEAVGLYGPDAQMEVALGSGATMVSVSIREICRAEIGLVRAFFQRCVETGIAVQHILYDRADCDLLKKTLPATLFQSSSLQLLFVLGRYSQDLQADPNDLSIFLKWLAEENIAPDWAVCAFGKTEAESLLKAHRAGGKCRIGFENSLYLSTGRLAQDNAEKVRDLLTQLAPLNDERGC